MNARTEPRNLAAVWAMLQPAPAPADPAPFNRAAWVAECRAQADATGESIGAIFGRRASSIMLTKARAADMAGAEWRRIPLDVRALLLTLECPELDGKWQAEHQPWAAFTEDQRGRIGAAARRLAAMLQGAKWLTR